MIKSFLIKYTTEKERAEIIKNSLNFCGDACEGCSKCDGLTGLGDPMEMYREYIEGKKEISEINAQIRFRYVK